jgi:hypothetical protein
VHVVSERLHARGKPFGVRLDVSVRRPVSLPAIVHVEVAVASIPQAAAHQATGHFPQHCLVNVAAELVPGTPAHHRCLAHAIEKACDSRPHSCRGHYCTIGRAAPLVKFGGLARDRPVGVDSSGLWVNGTGCVVDLRFLGTQVRVARTSKESSGERRPPTGRSRGR